MELKHIIGYLPYGLKAITTVDAREEFSHLEIDNYFIFDKGNIWTYCGYADSDLCIPLGEGEFNGFILRNEKSYADIQNFVKPILRPLSDLTKEIEVNGERFVPIEKLKLIIDEFGYAAPNIVFVKCFSGFFFEWYTGSQVSVRRSVPMSFYEKLYEWHFDLHSLIEKGEAIDINQLKK